MALDGSKPSYRLTFEDAVEVWIRHWPGEYQNRIASILRCKPREGE